MRLEKISEELKHVLDAIRRLIEKGETDHLRKDESGWQYGGMTFTELVDSLRNKMREELKSQDIYVAGRCTVRHFFRGANITPSDRAKGLLIIPINGVSTLYPPGEELPLDTYCFIDNQPTISGENIDVVFVAFEVQKETT